MSLISHITVGSFTVISLRDGEISLPSEVLLNLTKKEEISILESQEKACHTNFNAFLVQDNERTLLIDTGCRDLFGLSCGFLVQALEEVGITPSDITDLFLTHMHPDHIAGAIDAKGNAIFKNASLKVTENDFNFWMRDDFAEQRVNGIHFANLAKAVFSAYGERCETLLPETDIISGVSVLDLPGHTPGHSGFRIDSLGSAFVHMGDILHVPNLQLANPDVSVVFDIDPEVALGTRKTVFDMICSDKILCSAGHVILPRFGYLEAIGSGYRFL